MKKFQSIQYLRAIAALMVVFHHARNPLPWLYDPLAEFGAGQAGVDIFFVISGFVMYSAARNESTVEFLRRRIIRIVPLYWAATAVKLALLWGTLQFSADLLAHITKSLLFVPHYSLEDPSQIWPFLTPGWTLNFEMFFYLIFAAGIYLKRLVPLLAASLGALVAAGLLYNSSNALWLTYTSPILLEFLAGVLIARWVTQGSPRLLWLLLPAGFIALALTDPGQIGRALAWGVPALLIVLGAVVLEIHGKLPDVKVLGVLGDASYSIYLFQFAAHGISAKILQKIPISGMLQFVCMVLVCLSLAIVIGVTLYYVLERPMIRLLNRRRAPAS